VRTKRCVIGRVVAAGLLVAAWLALGASAGTATPPHPHRPHPHLHLPHPVRAAAARTTTDTPRPVHHGPPVKASGVPAALRSVSPSQPAPATPPSFQPSRVGQPAAASPAPAAAPPLFVPPAPLSPPPSAVSVPRTPAPTGTGAVQPTVGPLDGVIGDTTWVVREVGKTPLARVAHSYVVVLSLAGLVLLFLVVHRRFDRREPKLASAPGTEYREYLEFA